MTTKQMEFWNGQFGADYTDRNTFSVEDLDNIYSQQYGTSRTDMNRFFLDGLRIERILEVGCNVGNQLRILQHMGYESLYGIELQNYAVERAKSLCQNINIIQGSAFDIPFKDEYFDLVYTSGVLIHVSPEDIEKALQGIYRASRRYIWGFEYFSEEYEEKEYRGNHNVLWKTNFMKMYLDLFPNLKVVREAKYKYTNNDQVDQMFLLEKF